MHLLFRREQFLWFITKALLDLFHFSWSPDFCKTKCGGKHINGINKAACNEAICHFKGRLCSKTESHKHRTQRPVYKAVVAANCSSLLVFFALFLPVFEVVFVDPWDLESDLHAHLTLTSVLLFATKARQMKNPERCITRNNVLVVVNFLPQLIFIFPLFFGMVMYAKEFETKENKKYLK